MKSILLIILFFIATVTGGYSQTDVPVFGPVHSFSSEGQAREVIQKIVDVVGLKPNFEIRAGDVPNALAVVYDGKRYILYNPVFLKQVREAIRTDWGGISIIAHEIGHHLNGHTLTETGSVPSIELEADEFAGFVLRKMGASLSEAQAAIGLISDERGSHTHPGRSYRLASIEKGWKNAHAQMGGERYNPQEEAIAESQDTQEPVEEHEAELTKYSFPSQYIYKQLHLFEYPDEKIFLTVNYNLVRVNDQGYEVIGKVISYEDNYYLKLGKDQYFLISPEGYLTDEYEERVGYLSGKVS